MSPAVTIDPDVHAALLCAHRTSAPRELAGALGGARAADHWHVARFVPLANGAAAPDRFAVDPHAFVRALACLERDGDTWLGFVHGHPGGPAAPSAADEAELWRECLHLIVGDAGAPVRGWCWAAAGWCEVPLRLHPERA